MREFEPLWGNWYLLNPIGTGSFGTVYRAKQEVFGRTYYSAVKHISIPRDDAERMRLEDDLATNDEELLNEYCEQKMQSIISEYDVQHQFSGHPNFVQVMDVMPQKKQSMPGYDLFIRMELLNSLNTRFKGNAEPEKEAIRLGMDICRALSVMHGKHMMHRDIKAQNILVSDDGVYKLADFGAARMLTGNQSFMSIRGNMETIAPEVISLKAVGFTADIYSLGLVLYRLLNHHCQPFMQKGQFSDEEARIRRLSGEKLPPPDEASEEMAAVILRACEYEPGDRWPSADEMYGALEKIGKGKLQEETEPDDILWKIELLKISEELSAYSVRLGERRTESGLMEIRTRLVQLPGDRQEVIQTAALCDELIRKNRDAVAKELEEKIRKLSESVSQTSPGDRNLKWKNDLLSIANDLDACSDSLGKTQTEKQLTEIRSRLEKLPQDRQEVARYLKLCDDLILRNREAVKEDLAKHTQKLRKVIDRKVPEAKKTDPASQPALQKNASDGAVFRPGSDVKVMVELTPWQIENGCTRTVGFVRYDVCPVCVGTGKTDGKGCLVCEGTGMKPVRASREVTFTPHPDASGYSLLFRGEGNRGTKGMNSGNLRIDVRPQETPDTKKSSLTAGGTRGIDKKMDGGDVMATVVISEDENLHGCQKRVEYLRKVRCAACNGSGMIGGRVCTTCRGEKRTERKEQTMVILTPHPAVSEYSIVVKSMGSEGLCGGANGNLFVKVQIRKAQKSVQNQSAGRRMQTRNGIVNGADVIVDVNVTPSENRTECTKQIEYRRKVKCEVCKGSGQHSGVMCRNCLGEGRISVTNTAEVTLAPHPGSSMYTKVCKELGNEGIRGTNGNLLLRVHVKQ